MFFANLSVLAVMVAVSLAHLCLLSPPQRGSLDGFNKAAAPDCGLTTAPCGGRSMSSNPILLRAGQTFRVIFQKNLDHFYQPNAGHFSISFGTTSRMTALSIIPDSGQPPLTLFSRNITIPSVPAGQYILQTTYDSQNPQAGVFYECGDVTIV